MANTSIIKGLVPANDIDKASVNLYYIPSSDGTAVFKGDLVKAAGSADSNGIPTVAQAAAGASTDIHVGVVVAIDQVSGIAPASSNLYQQYRPASTGMYVLVCDDPDMLYYMQGSGTAAAADIGLNADITVGSGDTTSGQSGMQLDLSTKNTTATLPLKIKRIIVSDDNALGASCKLLVQVNAHVGKSGVVGL